jgi:hypothetical protein
MLPAMRARAVLLPLLAAGCLPAQGPSDAGPAVAPGWVVSTPVAAIDTLHDVVTLGPGSAWAVGSAGTVLRAVDGAWSKVEVPAVVDLLSVSARIEDDGTQTIAIAGAAGTILVGNGGPFAAIAPATEQDLYGVWVADPQTVYAVGAAGVIVRVAVLDARVMEDESLQERQNEDGSVEYFPIPEALKAVGGGWRDDVVAVGARGAVYHYDGTSWSREDADTSRPLTDLFTGAGIWSTTTDGVILYRNGFSDWDTESFRAPAPVFLQGVWTNWDLMVAVGFAGALFVRQDGAWESVPVDGDLVLRAVSGVVVEEGTEEVPAVYDVYAVGGGGRIVRGPTALPDVDAGSP